MITLGGGALNLDAFEQIVIKKQEIGLSTEAGESVSLSFRFLESFSRNKLIYGINTGFGPMAQYRIEDQDLRQLQINLIRSHSSGMGERLSPESCRAILVSRLNTLILGYSGIEPGLVEQMIQWVNADISPCLYAHGGVGASGDLVQLAHLALGLLGEGDCWWKGEIHPCRQVMDALGIAPMEIHIREGLALLNGTSAMTGIGAMNLHYSHKLIRWSTLISFMLNEIMEVFDDPFSEELNQTKLHPGQREIAGWIRSLSQGSAMLKTRQNHLYSRKITESVISEKVQEAYSLRCIPQILGPIRDTIRYAEEVVIRELNSVNDNPVVDRQNQNIFHGGNFHGDYVALEMDKLKLAMTKLSLLAERQINYMLNPHLNQKLPPFANAGKLGLNFGIQGMQYPATSTVAENQALSSSLYVHSIPSNNDNQDVVSMGCNAALSCQRVIENSFEVLSIAAATLVQAIDLLDCQNRIAPASLWFYEEIRNILPFFREDQAPYLSLNQIREWLKVSEMQPLVKY